MPFLDWLFGHRPAEQQPQQQAVEVDTARPPRPGARGNADFEAAAAGHLAPVLPPPARDLAIDNDDAPQPGQPENNALPFFLWAIALHHPLTAVAGLGFAGGMVLYGTAMAGGRLVRYATRGGRHQAEQQGGNALADAERRLADLINAHRAEGRINAEAFARHFGPPRARRYLGARPDPPTGPHQSSPVLREVQARIDALLKRTQRPGEVEDENVKKDETSAALQEQTLPTIQDASPITAPLPSEPVIAPIADFQAEPEGQQLLANLQELARRQQQQLKEKDQEIERLLAKCKRLAKRLDPDTTKEGGGQPSSARSAGSSTLPSANNVDLTGPMLAQTRPINNVDPDDIPGPTPRSTSVSDDTSAKASATASAPPTSAASEPDFKVADIHTAMRELAERYQREATSVDEPLSPNSTATWDEDVNTGEDDATITARQQEVAAISDDASSMATWGQDAGSDASSEPESTATITDVQRAVDHSTTSDSSATTARARSKGKGKKKASVPASATSSDDSGETVMHRSEGSLEAANLRQAIAESLHPQAPSRDPAQGEAGPSTYTGARQAEEPSSPPPPPPRQPQPRPRAQDTGTRRSFRFRDDITVPLPQGWHTIPIMLTLSSEANAEHSGLGWGYQRRQSASRTFTTTARLFITHDVHLIEFDGACWRVALEGNEYVLQGRYDASATE